MRSRGAVHRGLRCCSLPELLAACWLLPAGAGVGAAQACSFAPGVRPGGRVTFFCQKKVTKEEAGMQHHSVRPLCFFKSARRAVGRRRAR